MNPQKEQGQPGPVQARVETAIVAVTVLLVIEFLGIPILWATDSLEGRAFWIAQGILIATVIVALLLIQGLKRAKSRGS